MFELVFIIGVMVPFGVLAWSAAVFLITMGVIYLRDLLKERGLI